jgi:hypothetical protein
MLQVGSPSRPVVSGEGPAHVLASEVLQHGLIIGEQATVRRPKAQWFHARFEGAALSAVPRAEDRGVSVCEPARGEKWAMGPGTHCRQNEGIPGVKPMLVGQVEFVELTPDNRLRHSRFIALRKDRDARMCGGNREGNG